MSKIRVIDKTDMQILKYLKTDSRLQWKEIGEMVHMTGQAVAARVEKMKELGVIKRFLIELDHAKLGKSVTAFITVFMKSSNHSAFQHFINNSEGIEEAHRISGEGCYWLKACIASQDELNRLLDGILRYGNYRLSISIGGISGKRV